MWNQYLQAILSVITLDGLLLGRKVFHIDPLIMSISDGDNSELLRFRTSACAANDGGNQEHVATFTNRSDLNTALNLCTIIPVII